MSGNSGLRTTDKEDRNVAKVKGGLGKRWNGNGDSEKKKE